MKRLFCIISILCLLAPAASAQTKAQKQKKARLEREIAILDKQIKENNAKTKDAGVALKLTRSRISSRRELIAETEYQIRGLVSETKEKARQIDSLSERLDTLSSRYDRLIKNAYKNRDTRIWYMYILSSGNLGQGFRRYGYLRSLAGTINGQGVEIRDTRARIEKEKARLDSLRIQTETMRSAHQLELDELRKDELSSMNLVASLQRDKAKYQDELASKKKQMDELNRQIAKMLEKSASRPRTEKDVKLEKEFAANKGKLPWPADGPVVDSFGVHNHPVYTNVQMPPNNGINIALSKDSAVKSVFNGTVSHIAVVPGYNQCVLIEHGGYFTFYCKLATVNVKPGDKVTTGQVIGRVDTIGGETQLHFEIRKGKEAQNPAGWLR